MKFLSPWIQTTNECNLRCKYCFVDYNKEYISRSGYDRIFEIFSKYLNNGELEYLKFRISGGEPMIKFDHWCDKLENFLNNYPNASAEILTNFTILNDKIYDFLLRNDRIGLNVSLDSVSHSKIFSNGTSSHKIVMNNIDKIKNNKDIFIMTVVTDNGIHLPDLSKYIVENGFKWEIQFNKYYENNFDKNIMIENLDAVLNNVKQSGFDILNKLLFNFCDFKEQRMCEAGYRMCYIDTDLNVHHCQMNNKTFITNINNNDLIHKLEGNKYSLQINDSNCINCIIKKYCHGDCKINNIDERKKEYFCDIMKYYIINFGGFILKTKGV